MRVVFAVFVALILNIQLSGQSPAAKAIDEWQENRSKMGRLPEGLEGKLAKFEQTIKALQGAQRNSKLLSESWAHAGPVEKTIWLWQGLPKHRAKHALDVKMIGKYVRGYPTLLD